jgi:hypothetical protein
MRQLLDWLDRYSMFKAYARAGLDALDTFENSLKRYAANTTDATIIVNETKKDEPGNAGQ